MGQSVRRSPAAGPHRSVQFAVAVQGSDQSGLKDLKHVLNKSGPEGFAKAVRAHKGLLLTDTTWCELLSFCACVLVCA